MPSGTDQQTSTTSSNALEVRISEDQYKMHPDSHELAPMTDYQPDMDDAEASLLTAQERRAAADGDEEDDIPWYRLPSEGGSIFASFVSLLYATTVDVHPVALVDED